MMKRSLIILVLILGTGLESLHSERAMYIWGMAYQLTTKASNRSEFYSFVKAPKARRENEIKTLYFNGYEVLNYEQPKLKRFLADMHSRGLCIYCLGGDPLWASSLHEQDGENFCQKALDFNRSGVPEERFDGILFDVEPYGLGDWNTNNKMIWTNYIRLLSDCKARVDAYNITNSASMEFGDSIPVWYDTDSSTNTDPWDAQTNTHFVVLMDYTDDSNQMVMRATNECRNGVSLGRKVVVAAETYSIPSPSETFWQEGNDFMEKVFHAVSNSSRGLGRYSSFKGFAVHFYENRGSENAYRNLNPPSPYGHISAPVVFLNSPNGNDGISYCSNIVITWNTIDYEGQPLSVNLQYSSNNGTNWLDLPGVDKEGNIKNTNDGRYVWDISSVPEKDTYRVKVLVWDNNFTNYDVSDYALKITRTMQQPTNVWSQGYDTGNEGCKPEIVYDDQNPSILHCVYNDYCDVDNPSANPCGVYYKKSTDAGKTWQAAIAISAESTNLPRKPSLSVKKNLLAIAYLYRNGNYRDIRLRMSTDGGSSWAPEETVDTGGPGTYKWQEMPAVAVDSRTNVHVVWTVRETGGNQYWLLRYRKRNASGTWNAILNVANGVASTVLKSSGVCVDNNDNVHIAWHSRSWATLSYEIRYRCMTNNGNFGPNTQVWTMACPNDQWYDFLSPSIMVSGEYVHLAWHTAGADPSTANTVSSNMYSRRTNVSSASWSAPVCLARGYVPTLSGQGSFLHAVWYHAAQNGFGEIRYMGSTNKGATWSTPIVVDNNASPPYLNVDFNPILGNAFLSTGTNGNSVITWRDNAGSNPVKYKFKYKSIQMEPASALSINLVNGDRTSLKLKWTSPSSYYPNYYKIYRATNFSTNFLLINNNVVSLEYLDTGLFTNIQYKYKVQAVLASRESEMSRPSNLLSPGTRFLIDYFEGNEEMGTGTKIGTSTLSYHITNQGAFQGTKALALMYSYSGAGWGAGLFQEFVTPLDLSDYTTLRMAIKGDGSTNKLKVGFKESSGANPEVFVSRHGVVLTNTQWKEYEFSFSDFEKTDGIGNGIFDKDSVAGYQLTYDTKGASSLEHFIDQIYLVNLAASLELSIYSISFGNVRFQSNDKRMQTVPVIITARNLPSPYTIRIYTDDGNNSTTNAGLAGQRYMNTWLPLKVWCANFGPEYSTNTNKGPDEENEYFWNGYDFNADLDRIDSYSGGIFTEGTNAGEYPFDLNGNGFLQGEVYGFTNYNLTEESKWLWVPEKNQMDPFNHWTWRRLSYTGSELPSPFKIFLGVDLTGVRPQLYKGTMIIEALIE